MELGSLLLSIAWAVPVASAWWAAVAALRRAKGSKHRNRIRYLGVALFGFLVGDLLITVGGTAAGYAGLASRLVGLAVIAFAILRHDLPDLKHLSLVALRVGVLASITSVLYVTLLLTAGLLAGGLDSAAKLQVVLPAVIGSVLVAAVIDVAFGHPAADIKLF